MKKYTIELSDDLANIYEDIAKYNKSTTKNALEIILERVITTMLRAENNRTKYKEKSFPFL